MYVITMEHWIAKIGLNTNQTQDKTKPSNNEQKKKRTCHIMDLPSQWTRE